MKEVEALQLNGQTSQHCKNIAWQSIVRSERKIDFHFAGCHNFSGMI